MKFELAKEDKKIVDFYDTEVHLKKLVEELDELKKATDFYLASIGPMVEDRAYRAHAQACFFEEFVDVAIKMRHVYEKIIRPNCYAAEMCDCFEQYKLARQMVRMSLKDESFGSTKQKEAA